MELGDLLFKVDIFFAHSSDLGGVLNPAIGQAESEIDFGFFHGGDDLFTLGRVRPGFEVFLEKVDSADGIAQFIAIEQTDLQIGFDHGGVGRDGFFELFDGCGVVEIGDIFARLAEERITFVFGIGSWRGLLARGENEGGQKGGEERFVHSAIMITRWRFRKPRLWLLSEVTKSKRQD